MLGTSPRFLGEMQGKGIRPSRYLQLYRERNCSNVSPEEIGSFDALRCIGSTGAVLTPPLFEWTQKAFGDIHLTSGSGGTDICAGCECTLKYLGPCGLTIEKRKSSPDAPLCRFMLEVSVTRDCTSCIVFIVIIDTEIQCKALGMKVEVFDPSGNNIEGTGIPGELVCTRPHPSIPIKFWGDTPDRKKFKETYYSTYPG
jgi:acetoacetyl-CoA synthetase